MTRGEEIILAFDEALSLDALRLEDYEEVEIRGIVERLGSRAERFFKSAVFPGATAEDTFDGLINRLKSAGIDKNVRARLHALRDLYNEAKHDPNANVRSKRAADVIGLARGAIEIVIATALGATSAPVEKVVSRLLWVSVYDDYPNGVSQVYVSLPFSNDAFATHLDIVWIKLRDWDAVKADLVATNCFHYGEANFTSATYERFKENDFLNAAVWDGDYRQLIRILSQHEDRQTSLAVLPVIRRDHMYIAVLSAIALAGVDVASVATAPLAAGDFKAAILDCADRVYAMPGVEPWVESAAARLAELIVQLPFASWGTLTGPFWNVWNPKPLVAAIPRDEGTDLDRTGYLIDDAYRVVIV